MRRQDFAGGEIVSVRNCAQNASVNHPFGQGEQQVQHLSAARDLFQQAGMPWPNSGQARQRRKKWSERMLCFGTGIGRGRELFGRHRDNGRFPCSSG